MAIVTINRKAFDVSEYELVGILCYMCHNELLPLPFDVDISIYSKPMLVPDTIPKSCSLVSHYTNIQSFCNSLMLANNYPSLDVNINSKYFKYYINPNETQDFVDGYTFMIHYMKASFKDFVPKSQNYKDHWPSNPEYVQSCTLVAVPGEIVTGKEFKLSKPAYLWDLPKDNVYIEQLVSNLIALFLRDAHADDCNRLLNDSTYLRFMLYQDAPDTCTYAYAYIRDIDECTYLSHKKVLTLQRANGTHLPCEVNTGKTGHFFEILKSEFSNRCVTNIGSFE